jgi:glycosyltransferase involved in cell wall biosynthesis
VKIAYVITRSEPMGGAQVHVRDLSVALSREGHDVTVLTGGTGRFTEELTDHGVSWLPIPHLQSAIHPLADARAFGHLRAALKTLRPELVSTHSSKAGVLGRIAARSLRSPVIFTAHGWAFTPGSPRRTAALYRFVERSVAPLAARIITVSDFDRELAIRAGVAAADHVTTIHNGVPDTGLEHRADPTRSPVRLIMVARFEQQKDHRTLLESLAGLTDLSWHLDLVGEGPALPATEALAERLGLDQRVQFWGARRDIAHRLAGAQVFMLISNWEGFPRSILEAMRAGLPVVASNVGGVSESVQHERTGIVVPRGDVEVLRAGLRRLLTNPDVRGRMGADGRRRYEELFRLELTAARTVAVYHDVLAQCRRIDVAKVGSTFGSGAAVAEQIADPESVGERERGTQGRSSQR